jgi:pilus assembly protein Flp/PilA
VGSADERRGKSMNLFVMRTWLQARFTATERGASMVEYILLVALIALAVIAAVSFLGGTMTGKFNSEGSQISSAGS